MNKEVLTKIKNFVLGLEKEDTKLSTDVKLAEMKLDNGTVVEAEVFESDQPIFIVTEDGSVPLPIGEYKLEDGTILVVVEEGIIAEIKAAEEEEDKPEEEEMAVEYVTKEEFTSAIKELKEGMANLNSEKDDEISKLSKETETLQTKLDEKPDAENIKHAPVELKKVPARTAKERILEKLRTQ